MLVARVAAGAVSNYGPVTLPCIEHPVGADFNVFTANYPMKHGHWLSGDLTNDSQSHEPQRLSHIVQIFTKRVASSLRTSLSPKPVRHADCDRRDAHLVARSAASRALSTLTDVTVVSTTAFHHARPSRWPRRAKPNSARWVFQPPPRMQMPTWCSSRDKVARGCACGPKPT